MGEESTKIIVNQENAGYAMQQFAIEQQVENQNRAKVENLKNRLSKFESVESLSEARDLVKKTLPVANEINRFRVGNAKCIVINKEDLIRISVDTDDEYLCYDFE